MRRVMLSVCLVMIAGCGGNPGGPVRVMPLSVKMEKDLWAIKDGLKVYFSVANTSANRRMGWRQEHDAASMTDEFGNTYECIRLTAKRFIDPGQVVDCSASFDVPIAKAKHFTVQIGPGVADGFAGTVFTFDRPPDGFPPD